MDFSIVLQILLAAVSGGALVKLIEFLIKWLDRRFNVTDKTVDGKLKLTLSDREQLDKFITDMRNDLSSNRKELGELRSELMVVKTDNARLSVDNHRLLEDNQELRRDNNELRDALNEREIEFRGVVKRLARLENRDA